MFQFLEIEQKKLIKIRCFVRLCLQQTNQQIDEIFCAVFICITHVLQRGRGHRRPPQTTQICGSKVQHNH